VALESASLRPEDAAINVWHFWSLTDDPADSVVDINANIQTFYAQIEELFCANTLTGEGTLKFYDLSDPEPRAVIEQFNMSTLSPTAGDGLPTECAICLSFGGAPGSGLNAKRRNGRLYIGPLSNGVTSTITGSVIVSSAAVTTLSNAAVAAIGYPTITNAWSVFSPTEAGPQPWDEATLEAATTFVTRGFVNNSFDTQRRRGTVETSRAIFP
jgi:hypothetical protein